jgi:4-hydroxybenzoate polyprenyltransferase
LRALRPHQWAKNALLMLPALAAHLPVTLSVLGVLLSGFVAFSLAASAIYVLNDLVDLPHDRCHVRKRRRPFAAGDVPIPVGIAMIAVLGVSSLLLTLPLPRPFLWVLLGYLALTTAYSFSLKRVPAVDVLALATLYTARVVAGAALVSVPLSRWFLAFSVFLFLSLALVKRVVELQGMLGPEGAAIPGRGYVLADIPVLTALGAGATLATALVYCLYITSSEVNRLYSRPDLLWLELPVLLYWQIRVWLLTGRRQMTHDDPVVFALRDRASHVTLAVFLFVMLTAV